MSWKQINEYIWICFISCIILGSCFVKSDYDKGMEYYKQGKYSEAVKYFKKGAKGGNFFESYDFFSNEERKKLCSSYYLGKCYFYGWGVEKDYRKAVEYLEKVDKDAILDYSLKAESAFMIGKCYFYGKGIEQDLAEAYNWFEKARMYDHNCNDALFFLGVCYFYGKGVKKNYIEAFKLLEKAAESDCDSSACAYFLLGECHKNGYGTYGSAKNPDKEKECKKKAAEKGCPKGQCWFGFELRSGIEENRDYPQAVDWFKKAAEQGNGDAMKELAWHYRSGKGVEKDIEKAKYWEEKAQKVLDEKIKTNGN